MANQKDYTEPLPNLLGQRPFRISAVDHEYVFTGNREILFGTTNRDNVEIWIYSSSGQILANARLSATDPALTLSEVVDVTGVTEYLDVDIEQVAERIGLAPGKYSFTANFFRDEVGSLNGYKLQIVDISGTRTEIRVKPLQITDQTTADIFEFVSPSVPPVFAQALIDQIFGVSLNDVPVNEYQEDNVIGDMDGYMNGTSDRISTALANPAFDSLYSVVIQRAYIEAVQNLVDDAGNLAVELPELTAYIENAIRDVLNEINSTGELDARFQLV